MHILAAACLLLMLFLSAFGQSVPDVCHVYVIDVAKAKQDERALGAGQTIFPEFNPVIGEEELTIKRYPFPGSKLVITASVFYTDESMASHPHGEFVSHSESMLIGITVGSKARRNAISAGAEGAIAEVTYDQFTNIVRAEKYIAVRGRSYLVGIECDCMAEKRPKTVETVNPNSYNLVVVENPNRKNSSSQNVPKDLNVVVGDKVIARIQLPIRRALGL